MNHTYQEYYLIIEEEKKQKKFYLADTVVKHVETHQRSFTT